MRSPGNRLNEFVVQMSVSVGTVVRRRWLRVKLNEVLVRLEKRLNANNGNSLRVFMGGRSRDGWGWASTKFRIFSDSVKTLLKSGGVSRFTPLKPSVKRLHPISDVSSLPSMFRTSIASLMRRGDCAHTCFRHIRRINHVFDQANAYHRSSSISLRISAGCRRRLIHIHFGDRPINGTPTAASTTPVGKSTAWIDGSSTGSIPGGS